MTLEDRAAGQDPFFLPGMVLQRQLGQGTYGMVYHMRWTLQRDLSAQLPVGTTIDVAVKRIPNLEHDAHRTQVKVLRELSTLRRLQYSSGVIGFYGAYTYKPAADRGVTDVYIINDLAEMDIANALSRNVSFPIDSVRYIVCQLLLVARAMAKDNVAHRDLSSRNILISGESEAYVCDFGLSRFLDPEERLSLGVVTQWYRAPEVLLDATYDAAIDVWAVGVLMAELMMRQHLFPGKKDDPADQLNKVIALVGTPDPSIVESGGSMANGATKAKEYLKRVCEKHALPNRIDELASSFKCDTISEGDRALALELLHGLLKFDPKDRITSEEALASPFFNPLREFILDEKKVQDEPEVRNSLEEFRQVISTPAGEKALAAIYDIAPLVLPPESLVDESGGSAPRIDPALEHVYATFASAVAARGPPGGAAERDE